MPNGTVKWFNPNKGFGNTLNDGAKISFELETGKNGKVAAVNLQSI